MTDDFERDYYTPVVYNSHKLQAEVTAIKKITNREPGLVPMRVMGLFHPEVLSRANVNEAQASLLYQTLTSPSFNPNNSAKIEEIRTRYGQEVVTDVVRCWKEIDYYNASAGHPVYVPWVEEANREMTSPEVVETIVKKYKQANEERERLSKETEKLREERTLLKTENEQLKLTVVQMRKEYEQLCVEQKKENGDNDCAARKNGRKQRQDASSWGCVLM